MNIQKLTTILAIFVVQLCWARNGLRWKRSDEVTSSEDKLQEGQTSPSSSGQPKGIIVYGNYILVQTMGPAEREKDESPIQQIHQGSWQFKAKKKKNKNKQVPTDNETDDQNLNDEDDQEPDDDESDDEAESDEDVQSPKKGTLQPMPIKHKSKKNKQQASADDERDDQDQRDKDDQLFPKGFPQPKLMMPLSNDMKEPADNETGDTDDQKAKEEPAVTEKIDQTPSDTGGEPLIKEGTSQPITIKHKNKKKKPPADNKKEDQVQSDTDDQLPEKQQASAEDETNDQGQSDKDDQLPPKQQASADDETDDQGQSDKDDQLPPKEPSVNEKSDQNPSDTVDEPLIKEGTWYLKTKKASKKPKNKESVFGKGKPELKTRNNVFKNARRKNAEFSPVGKKRTGVASKRSSKTHQIVELCKQGVDPNIGNADNNNFTALHLAVITGAKLEALLLLKCGANPNAVDNYGNSPLHIAVMDEKYWIAIILLLNHADPFLRNQIGYTPEDLAHNDLYYSTRKLFQADVLNWLSTARELTLQEKKLHYKAKTRNYLGVMDVCMKGVDVNVQDRDRDNNTALHLSVMSHDSSEETVLIILHCGANVNAQNGHGNTPLHLAILNGHANVTIALLVNKADPFIPNKWKETAYQLGRRSSDPVIAETFNSENYHWYMDHLLEN